MNFYLRNHSRGKGYFEDLRYGSLSPTIIRGGLINSLNFYLRGYSRGSANSRIYGIDLSQPLTKDQHLALEINGDVITNSRELKQLGVTLDSQLTFKSHTKVLCVTTNHKVSAFPRVAKYIDIQKAKLLYQLVIVSTLKYCPLIWIFCRKTANDNIDRVHKWTLRILLDDHESTFQALLAKNGEPNIHTQNLRMLMIEIYKPLNNTNLPFMQEYSIRQDVKYNLDASDSRSTPELHSLINIGIFVLLTLYWFHYH